MAKGQKTIYKNSAVILRLVLGILSIVISAVVGFQSCAAGIGEAISEAESSSGAGGLFTGFFLLAAGIVAIAARKTKGGTIASIILYALAAIFAFANLSENFGDLVVWAVLSVIFAVVLLITLFLKEKDSSDETTKEYFFFPHIQKTLCNSSLHSVFLFQTTSHKTVRRILWVLHFHLVCFLLLPAGFQFF